MQSFPSEMDVLEDVSRRLSSAHFLFMVTGSMAMNYYAQPRMTRDIDIVIAMQVEDQKRIVKVFEDAYYISDSAVRDALTRHSMFNIIHNQSVVKVDFILLKDDPYRRAEFERRQQIIIGSFKTYMVSKEDLILSKMIWAKASRSEMQIRDIHNLIHAGYDKRYLLPWIKRLDLTAFWKEICNE